jgi:hypothetical protein
MAFVRLKQFDGWNDTERVKTEVETRSPMAIDHRHEAVQRFSRVQRSRSRHDSRNSHMARRVP